MNDRGGYFKQRRSTFVDGNTHWQAKYWRERRKFSRYEATVDLVERAAFADYEKNAREATIRIPRGHVLASVRGYAKRWGWEQTAVHRFLKRLERDGNLQAVTATPLGTLYRLTWYEFDQGDATPNATANATDTQHSRNNNKKGKKGKNVKPVSPPAPEGAAGDEPDPDKRFSPSSFIDQHREHFGPNCVLGPGDLAIAKRLVARHGMRETLARHRVMCQRDGTYGTFHRLQKLFDTYDPTSIVSSGNGTDPLEARARALYALARDHALLTFSGSQEVYMTRLRAAAATTANPAQVEADLTELQAWTWGGHQAETWAIKDIKTKLAALAGRAA